MYNDLQTWAKHEEEESYRRLLRFLDFRVPIDKLSLETEALLLYTSQTIRNLHFKGKLVMSSVHEPAGVLGGSWVVIISRVISRITILITHIRGLLTLLRTTP